VGEGTLSLLLTSLNFRLPRENLISVTNLLRTHPLSETETTIGISPSNRASHKTGAMPLCPPQKGDLAQCPFASCTGEATHKRAPYRFRCTKDSHKTT
jgi:hypothetical protein